MGSNSERLAAAYGLESWEAFMSEILHENKSGNKIENV
jgi:hypothetical protein